jgi:Ca2+:H+ antiporter
MTNSLFMLGLALLLGGLKYRTQEYNRAAARFQSGLLLLAAIALLVPSMIGSSDRPGADTFALQLSVGLSVLPLVAYVLGLLFSLGTHTAEFAGVTHGGVHEEEHL